MKNASVYRSFQGRKKILDFYLKIQKTWTFDYKEVEVETSYGMTHTVLTGNSDLPPLVLLHGAASNSLAWGAEIEALRREFRLIILDIPGEPGRSSEKRPDLKEDDYSLWLMEVCNKLRLHKFCIAGISFGGWIGLKFAVKFPESLIKLMLITPGGIINPSLISVLKTVIYGLTGEKGKKKLNNMIFGDNDTEPEYDEFASLIQKYYKYRFGGLPVIKESELQHIKIPVQIVIGSRDVFYDSNKMKRAVKNLKNFDLRIIKNGVHALVGIHKIMRDFLN